MTHIKSYRMKATFLLVLFISQAYSHSLTEQPLAPASNHLTLESCNEQLSSARQYITTHQHCQFSDCKSSVHSLASTLSNCRRVIPFKSAHLFLQTLKNLLGIYDRPNKEEKFKRQCDRLNAKHRAIAQIIQEKCANKQNQTTCQRRNKRRLVNIEVKITETPNCTLQP